MLEHPDLQLSCYLVPHCKRVTNGAQSRCDPPAKMDTRASLEPRIELMQAFWTGDARAPALLDAHPLLGAVPRAALIETVRCGCGFHTIWDVRALGQLRDVLDLSQSGTGGEDGAAAAAASLFELEGALSARGGLRAQARAVGMLLFRVAARAYG